MNRALIIDDEKVRVPNIKAFLERRYGKALSVHHELTIEDTDIFEMFDIVCLDHDLGRYGDCYEILKKLEAPENPTAHVFIHSMNPIGARNIHLLLVNDWGFDRRKVETLAYNRMLPK